MNTPYTVANLKRENSRFSKTGGVSAGNCAHRFVPAFYDVATGRAYASRFADGRPAPFHLLNGLPSNLVLERDSDGTVLAVKHSVIAGFLRDGRFYTRDQAAAAVA